jgi:geranylgeranyl transferase type-1 subunit beta
MSRLNLFETPYAHRSSLATQTWEGGFGQHPGLEAQGGTTYCTIASLRLISPPSTEEWSSGIDVAAATRYLVSRQLGGRASTGEEETDGAGGGFQGRPGKLEDVCYSFWCGGAMRVGVAPVSYPLQRAQGRGGLGTPR